MLVPLAINTRAGTAEAQGPNRAPPRGRPPCLVPRPCGPLHRRLHWLLHWLLFCLLFYRGDRVYRERISISISIRRRRGAVMARFVQIIEFQTSRIEDIEALGRPSRPETSNFATARHGF